MNTELCDDHVIWDSTAADPEKLGSYDVELNDSLSSFESVGSWMAQPQNAFVGETAPQTPPHSPSLEPCDRPSTRNRNFAGSSPLQTPNWKRIWTEPTSTPAACASPFNSSSRAISPGKPPRPPLLKKRSRRGILRSTRTSSRRSLLSSRSSHSSGSLTPNSRTPSSNGRRRRHRKRNSPFKLEKRVTFSLPDDSSVESSVSGSLLLCDVETMDNSLLTDHWGVGDDLGNQSCRILLPFMDGLDSDDEFALDEEDDDCDGGRLPVNMEDWFNSANELGCNFNSLDDDEFFSEGCHTPCRGETSGDESGLDEVEVCKSAEPSSSYTKNGRLEMQTPKANGIPVLPMLDDEHKTPVASNIHSAFTELEDKESQNLPTLTPIPSKDQQSDEEPMTKESPTSVMELGETMFQSKDDTAVTTEDDELSIDLEQCADRFASVHLGTEDIAVRDLGQRAVTKPSERKKQNHSSTAASSIPLDRSAVSPFECRRHVVLSPGRDNNPKHSLEYPESETAREGKPMISPVGRSSPGRSVATYPVARATTMSPIGRVNLRHPGRGL